MKEFKDTKIVGIDHGYGNIKIANTVTTTGIIAADCRPALTGEVLQYGDRFYLIGEGHKEFAADKSRDGDYYLLTLAAAAKELSLYGLHRAQIHLAVGLPLTWVGRQREDFRAYMLQEREPVFRFRDEEYRLTITGCSVYPQGYAAVVTRLGEFRGTNLIADIGNGTMNLLFMNGSRPDESRCHTEKAGVNQCMIAARGAVLDRFGVKIDDATLQQILCTGHADIDGAYLQCVTETARSYVGHVFDILRRYEYDPALMRLTVVGGGGCLVRLFGTYDRQRVTILDDICAAAKGYEYLAYQSLRKENQ